MSVFWAKKNSRFFSKFQIQKMAGKFKIQKKNVFILLSKFFFHFSYLSLCIGTMSTGPRSVHPTTKRQLCNPPPAPRSFLIAQNGFIVSVPLSRASYAFSSEEIGEVVAHRSEVNLTDDGKYVAYDEWAAFLTDTPAAAPRVRRSARIRSRQTVGKVLYTFQ